MHFTHFTLPRHRSPLFLSCLFGRPECTSVMLAAIQAAGFGGNELCVLVASPRGQTGQTGQKVQTMERKRFFSWHTPSWSCVSFVVMFVAVWMRVLWDEEENEAEEMWFFFGKIPKRP